MKNLNKAIKAQRSAGIYIRESLHTDKGQRYAKRTNKRAQRRMDKAIIREAI